MEPILILRNALKPMGDEPHDPGPSQLDVAVKQAAARYGQHFEDMQVNQLIERIVTNDSTSELRALFDRYLQRWDLIADAAWGAETGASTAERRDRIYGLLGVDAGFRRRCNELLPVQFLEEPVVIAESHQPWLTEERKGDCTFFYWSAYQRQLRVEGWSERSLIELGRTTDLIVERMEDPCRRQARQTKGLVVGYVQSGKTANFTAVLAKAADLGYRLIIILAGTLDILRNQTQRRVDKQMIGRELITAHVAPGDQHDYAEDVEWGSFLAHGAIPSDLGAFDWQRMTGSQVDYHRLGVGIEALEFRKQFPGRRFNDASNLATASAKLLVIKKNPTVLAKLARDLGALRARLEEVPALVIDDESDQAGVNVRPPGTDDRTATNRQIVALLGQLPRAQYLAYTATPYANVFINPDDEADLFPRDYIVPLTRPEGYMGARDFYDFGPRPDGYASNERAFVRSVVGDDDDDANLPRAVDSFVLAGMLKLYRERRQVRMNRHHTMLVHRSTRQADHRIDLGLVEDIFRDARFGTEPAHRRLSNLFHDEFRPVTLAQEPRLPVPDNYAELRPLLGPVLDLIGEQPASVVNGDPQFVDSLPNFEGPDRVWKILVGGTKLSRGYTVEGLTISYYRRKVRTADTLMQMGRWFGFRRNYRDLVRVFLGTAEPDGKETMDLNAAFRTICNDEEEFRSELRKYAHGTPPVRPMEVPPLVAQSLLLPTARNKMWHAHLVALNYGGEFVERTLVPYNSKKNGELLTRHLGRNPVAMAALSVGDTGSDAYVTTWSHHDMLDFLSQFEWSSEDAKALFEPVLGFLRCALGDPGIDRWQVLIPQIGAPEHIWHCAGHSLAVVQRGRDTRSPEGRYKTFSEPRHRAIARRLIGASDGAPASAAVLDRAGPRQGVMLLYPCRAPVDKGRIPALGFALLPPGNALPSRTKFTVATAAAVNQD